MAVVPDMSSWMAFASLAVRRLQRRKDEDVPGALVLQFPTVSWW